MKYKFNRVVLAPLSFSVILFILRSTLTVAGDPTTSAEQISTAQTAINLFFDHLATLMTFSISATQAWQSRKNNRIAFI